MKFLQALIATASLLPTAYSAGSSAGFTIGGRCIPGKYYCLVHLSMGLRSLHFPDDFKRSASDEHTVFQCYKAREGSTRSHVKSVFECGRDNQGKQTTCAITTRGNGFECRSLSQMDIES